MKLSELLKNVKTDSIYTDCEVSDITDKSNEITKACVFVCIKGNHFDGHSVAKQAEEMGAAAVIAEHDTGVKIRLSLKAQETHILAFAQLFTVILPKN